MESSTMRRFQLAVESWIRCCFGSTIASDPIERNHRFLEESLELVQSCGCTKDEALQLVEYVFSRPVGEKFQEIGGVCVTLSALASCHGLILEDAAETEIKRCWEKIKAIREKHAAKPKYGFQEKEIMDTNELPSGVYKHYKGGFYQLLGLGQHTETGELLVVYVALSSPIIPLPGPRIRCRPLSMWFDFVGEPKQQRRRFEYVGQEIPQEKDK